MDGWVECVWTVSLEDGKKRSGWNDDGQGDVNSQGWEIKNIERERKKVLRNKYISDKENN